MQTEGRLSFKEYIDTLLLFFETLLYEMWAKPSICCVES